MLSEAEGYDLLRDYGVPVPAFEHVTTPEAAGEAAQRIGFPVVMKIVSPQIVHKSDAGGVIVGVGSPDAGRGRVHEDRRLGPGLRRRRRDRGRASSRSRPRPDSKLIIGGKTDRPSARC